MPSLLLHPRVKLLSESFQPAQLFPNQKSSNKRRAIELLEHPSAKAPKKRKYNRRTEEQKEQDRQKPKRKYVRRTPELFPDAVPTIIAQGEFSVNQKKSKSKRQSSVDLKSMAACFCGEQLPAEDMISCSGLWCPKADMWMHHSCAKVTAEEVEYRQRMWLNWYCVECVEKRLPRKERRIC